MTEVQINPIDRPDDPTTLKPPGEDDWCLVLDPAVAVGHPLIKMRSTLQWGVARKQDVVYWNYRLVNIPSNYVRRSYDANGVANLAYPVV